VVILGKYLEVVSRGRTAAAIHELASHRAHSARLVSPSINRSTGASNIAISDIDDKANLSKDEGSFVIIPVNTHGDETSCEEDVIIDISLVHKGDILRLVAGESIPADGVIMSGKVSVDESMITGESLSVDKVTGDRVFGGTMSIEGSALLRVEVCGDKATLGKILALVQEAQSSRPAIQEVADRVASYFVPAVTCISFITFISWIIAFETGGVSKAWVDNHNTSAAAFAFYFALSVWVSACPCAFGLATPTAILVASGVAAKNGILIRKGAALQQCSEVLYLPVLSTIMLMLLIWMFS
jgi:Cu+-exporting ATPase